MCLSETKFSSDTSFLPIQCNFPVCRLHWAVGSRDYSITGMVAGGPKVLWAAHTDRGSLNNLNQQQFLSCHTTVPKKWEESVVSMSLWTLAWWNSIQQWPFAFGNSLSGFGLICRSHMAVDVPAPRPARLPLLAFGSHFISHLMLNRGVKSLEQEQGVIELILENQELQLSSQVCRGCGVLQSRRELESVLYFRWVRKISAAPHRAHQRLVSHWVISPGNFICRVLPWYVLFIMSLSTQQQCWKHFHSLVI